MTNILALIAFSVSSIVAAQTTPLSHSWFGYNPGAHAAKAGYWRQSAFTTATTALSAGTIRFPSGTAANYWNWTLGCEMPCGPQAGTSRLEDFAVTLAATGTAPLFVLNMLTDTLASQLRFLAHAESLGMPINFIELGNEFYNSHADYVSAFATGADYGKAASTWLAAIRSAYPAAAISVVGVPSYRDGNNARLTKWNDQLFAALVGTRSGDGVSMHEYDPTGVGTSGSSFTSADAAIMLGTPFATAARISTAAAALPTWATVWITEYNLLYSASKPDVPAFGTWAHGLYVATEAVLLAASPRVAAGRINKHCLVAYAYDGVLFEDTTSFDFDMSPDTTLATTTFGQSAAAVTLTLVAVAARNATAAAALAFSPNPPVQPGGGGAAYPSLAGTAFSGAGVGNAAVVVNLAATEYSWGAAPAWATSYKQVSVAAVTRAVNDAASQVTSATGSIQGGSVKLPPYSVTLITAAK